MTDSADTASDSTRSPVLLHRAKWLAVAVGLAMAVMLGFGYDRGSFLADAGRLTANPWGAVVLVETYAGFVLVSAWIVHRESSRPVASLWVVALLLLGHVVSAAYLWRAAASANGREECFWMGPK